MKNFLIPLLFCVQAAAAAEPRFLLSAGEWAVPRDADAVRAMPALREAVKALDARPGARLRLRYPGGDEGTMWVHEVRAWLVSLGVSSARLELVPGAERGDVLALEVVAPPGGQP